MLSLENFIPACIICGSGLNGRTRDRFMGGEDASAMPDVEVPATMFWVLDTNTGVKGTRYEGLHITHYVLQGTSYNVQGAYYTLLRQGPTQQL